MAYQELCESTFSPSYYTFSADVANVSPLCVSEGLMELQPNFPSSLPAKQCVLLFRESHKSTAHSVKR